MVMVKKSVENVSDTVILNVLIVRVVETRLVMSVMVEDKTIVDIVLEVVKWSLMKIILTLQEP